MHSNVQKNIFFGQKADSELPPGPQHNHVTVHPVTKCVTCVSTQNIPFASCAAESAKPLLSNVYLNLTKEPTACQSPVDDQKDMSSYRQCLYFMLR